MTLIRFETDRGHVFVNPAMVTYVESTAIIDTTAIHFASQYDSRLLVQGPPNVVANALKNGAKDAS